MLRFTLTIMICFAVNFCFAQTQLDMNADADKQYQKADKELNDVYKQILKEYKSDTAFIRNLKESQRIWIQFRDAEMMVKYPKREYGSGFSMCWTLYEAKLTAERTKALRAWLTREDEEDVCAGSVKTIEPKK